MRLTPPSAPLARVDLDQCNLRFSWTEAASVGSPVTQYEVYMRTESVNNFGNNNQWIVLPSCNINSTVTGFTNNFGGQGVYKYSCSFSRQQLAQYKIATTDYIQVQVRARNSVGFGAYSVQQANQARVSLPVGPAPITGFNAVKNGNSVTLQWNNSVVSDGVSYQVEADYGQGYKPIAQNSSQNGVTYQLPLNVAATRYNFRVTASSACGSQSALTSINVITRPNPPTLTITRQLCDAIFTWTQPTNTGGSNVPITRYTVSVSAGNNNQIGGN